MADPNRRDGFDGLSLADPAGPLTCYSAPPASQATLRGRLTDAAFTTAARTALGFMPPDAPGRAGGQGARAAFRLGPNEWLAVDDADVAFGRNLAATPGLVAIDMSSARARARLRGAAVRDLLAVGAAIDLRPVAFPAGAFAQTSMGNATAILHAREVDVFDIYIARSFASAWLVWLGHAGREFGLRLGGFNDHTA